ncbi:MAG: DUF1593 domain-containing protein [Asticcacaulis sp.]
MRTGLGLALWVMAAGGAMAAPVEKPRVIVISDIGNEPDDSESLVRYLLYANDLDTEGFIASTSTWQKDVIRPDLMYERIDAYGTVLPNLRRHAEGYPEASALRALVKRGQAAYGLAAVGEGKDTEGSEWLISQVDKPDPRPVWVLNWGGSVDLAQALYKVRKTRTPEELARFVSKIRVYAISDQDDAGPWVRLNFPDLFWIGSIHAFNDYAVSTWYGISGDVKLDKAAQAISGPDTSLVTNVWLDQNIRKGPLGELYPHHTVIMEGDTPAFLYLLRPDLSNPEYPNWGSWGGRYNRVSVHQPLFVDAHDTIAGKDGRIYTSNQATVWRWRQAYQNDFAARIQWTLTPDVAAGNHRPVAVLNGTYGTAPLEIVAGARETVSLSAAGSSDPDGQEVSFRWYYYQEAGENTRYVKVPLSASEGENTTLVVPDNFTGKLHVILEVWDNGTPALVTYRRAIISVGSAESR